MKYCRGHFTISFILYWILTGSLYGQEFSRLFDLPVGTEVSFGVLNDDKTDLLGFVVGADSVLPIVNHHKLFEAGSITKVFTTASALRVLQRHQIDIDAPVTDSLPSRVPKVSNKITFRRLVTHTSGLPKMPANFWLSAARSIKDPFRHYDERKMFAYLARYVFPSNPKFRYSNLGMSLLGFSISAIDDQPLGTIMRNEIFSQLGMNSTTLGITSEQYTNVANESRSARHRSNNWEFSDVTAGAGNLYTSVGDMTKFLKYLLKEVSNNDELASIFLQMEKQNYRISESEQMGLGWRIFSIEGKNIIYHGGITCGFKSLVAFERTSGKGVVVLTNAKGLSRKHLDLIKDVSFEFLAN